MLRSLPALRRGNKPMGPISRGVSRNRLGAGFYPFTGQESQRSVDSVP